MKKHLICCLLAVLLCVCVASSCAATWFVEPGTPRLHRDPFCGDTRLSTALHAPTVWLDDNGDGSREYSLCAACADAFCDAVETDATQVLYYNTDGGQRLHTDRNCPAVNVAYLPLNGEMSASEGQTAGLTACPYCTPVQPHALQNAMQAWNGTIEEKAAMMPGVWTLPSERAILPQTARQTAVAFMERSPELSGRFPDGVYTACVYHYDTAADAVLAREHYRVLVTTALQQPVALVCVDALTAEIFSVRIVEPQPE